MFLSGPVWCVKFSVANLAFVVFVTSPQDLLKFPHHKSTISSLASTYPLATLCSLWGEPVNKNSMYSASADEGQHTQFTKKLVTPSGQGNHDLN
jgi:hypothetical protein